MSTYKRYLVTIITVIAISAPSLAQEHRAAEIVFGVGVNPSLVLYRNIDESLYQLGLDDTKWTWVIISDGQWDKMTTDIEKAYGTKVRSHAAYTFPGIRRTYLRERLVSGKDLHYKLRHVIAHEWAHIILNLGNDDEGRVENYAWTLEAQGRKNTCSALGH